MSTTTRHATIELDQLVAAARRGDELAWSQLVDRFDRQLRLVAATYRLTDHDVDDAVQATWVKLHEHIDRIRHASAVAGWLVTTVRRESKRLLQSRTREHLTCQPDLGEDRRGGPQAQLLSTERRVVLNRALSTLPARQRQLMTLMVIEPAANYEQISNALDIPIGSIGPIRQRSLARLQRHVELRKVAGGSY
jgi:RNA polymerase sigma factor (sigma-70 family)